MPVRNVAINGTVTVNSGANTNLIDPIGVTYRKLASIDRPSLMMLLGPGLSAQYSNEWGWSARIGAPTQNLSQCQRYQEGLYFAFVDGHVELKKTAWVQYELKNYNTSAFFDWNAANPVPLINPN